MYNYKSPSNQEVKKDLWKFEKELCITLDEYIKNIISEGNNNVLSLEDKTWKGVAIRVNRIIENLV